MRHIIIIIIVRKIVRKKLYFDIATLQIYYKCVVVVFSVFLKHILVCWDFFLLESKKCLTSIFLVILLCYAIFSAKCTKYVVAYVSRNERSILTLKFTIFIVDNFLFKMS